MITPQMARNSERLILGKLDRASAKDDLWGACHDLAALVRKLANQLEQELAKNRPASPRLGDHDVPAR